MDRFCFIAIVKDESPVIERCLESVKGIMTSWLICDTGSTDDTVEKIQKYLGDVPGEVIKTEWVSYGETKSWLLERVHEKVKAEYIFWLDADEVLSTRLDKEVYPTKEDADKLYATLSSQTAPITYFTCKYSSTRYIRPQIARNNQLYQWRLPYQEYFVGTKDSTNKVVDGFYNIARHEGNSSRDPEIHKKREKMALSWLERQEEDYNNPDYLRMMYYLGELYSCMKGEECKKKAIKYYQLRTIGLTYPEERYAAYLGWADLEKDVIVKERILKAAIQTCPKRLEAYTKLMLILRLQRRYDEAYALSKKAGDPPKKYPQGLFIDTAVYSYAYNLERSLAAYYTGNKQLFVDITMQLYKRKDLPQHVRDIVEGNMKYI